MSQSFEIVEEKLREAAFFLDGLRTAGQLSFEARCYFSAFVSAARTVTLALQVTMKHIDGFNAWYEQAQARLKADPLARFFVEVRNDSVHKGLNPLGQVPMEHLREHLSLQFRQRKRSHVIVLPDPRAGHGTALADAVQVSSEYFKSLVAVVFDCYDRFRCVVDPRWYFTRENFLAMGKTFEDAVEELGLPRTWADCAPNETDAWRILRSQQPACLINDIFWLYTGRSISDPDGLEDVPK
ncbi:MAG: hypothetical protein ABR920_12280 [Terriglobales bacterium]